VEFTRDSALRHDCRPKDNGPIPTVLAFACLTFALVALWAPRARASAVVTYLWTAPCVLAFVLALASGLIDLLGVLVLLTFATLCITASRTASSVVRVTASVLVIAMTAGLFLHVLPGFNNPRVVTNAVLGPGSIPYSEYLNFDKGVAGLFLLGLYVPDRPRSDEGLRHGAGFLWRFAVLVAMVLPLALVLGYVRWDPKVPSWWALWLWKMVFLTALPEEALFRGVVQTSLDRWIGRSGLAILIAGTVFGIAHLAGGPAYIVLAAVAGIGYGWIYASTRSIAAAIAAHAGLNAVHFFFFSYPALGG
jgi:membrane protease YdiL (CAAX protease family)